MTVLEPVRVCVCMCVCVCAVCASQLILGHPCLDKQNVGWDDPAWAVFMGFEHERIHIETSSVLIREVRVIEDTHTHTHTIHTHIHIHTSTQGTHTWGQRVLVWERCRVASNALCFAHTRTSCSSYAYTHLRLRQYVCMCAYLCVCVCVCLCACVCVCRVPSPQLPLSSVRKPEYWPEYHPSASQPSPSLPAQGMDYPDNEMIHGECERHV